MHAYERVAADLAAEIESGVWPPGSMLPTIPDLEQRYGVSRITIRGGLDALARQGLVYTGYSEGRRGTIVRSHGRTDHYATDALRPDRDGHGYDTFVENTRRAGRTPSKRFEMRMIPAPKDIAQRLGIDAEDLVVVRIVYQLIDGEPWSREMSFYPRDLAEEAGLDSPRDIPGGTLRRLAEKGHREIAWVDEVTSEAATSDDVKDLSVELGTPLIVQTRTAATLKRVTRVTRWSRLGGQNRLIWEIGDQAGLSLIRERKAPR